MSTTKRKRLRASKTRRDEPWMKQYHSVRIGREVNGLLQDVADAVGKSKRRIIDALARFAARQPVGFIERILDDAESQGDKEGRAER